MKFLLMMNRYAPNYDEWDDGKLLGLFTYEQLYTFLNGRKNRSLPTGVIMDYYVFMFNEDGRPGRKYTMAMHTHEKWQWDKHQFEQFMEGYKSV